MKSKFYTYPESIQFVKDIIDQPDHNYRYNPNRNLITVYDEQDEKSFDFRLPLVIPYAENLNIIIQNYHSSFPDYVIILIQAGSAALATVSGDKITDFKRIRKYMVRKSRGKAQIKHLKTKGKSRLGSRIRLAQTKVFIEEINTWLLERENGFTRGRIIVYCSALLWGMLFSHPIQPSFNKKDERIIKIPTDVKVPDRNELLRIKKYVSKGEVKVYKEEKNFSGFF